MRLSVIVPTLNEEARIDEALSTVSECSGIAEVVVVDGGSEDATVELAEGAAKRSDGLIIVMSSDCGRARQMNCGANAATGDVLLFLHADTRLPDNASSHVASVLSDVEVVGGAFRTWTVDDRAGGEVLGGDGFRALARGAVLHIADIRSRYSSVPYGDQAIFVRREVFRRLGGFPELPLMEDRAFSERLNGFGRVVVGPACVTVSGRRFLAHPLRSFVQMNLFPLLYRMGFSVRQLSRLYGNPR